MTTDPPAMRLVPEDPATSTGDPRPENPFPAGGVQYAEWRTATLVAEERRADLYAQLLRNPASDQSIQEWAATLGIFDIWAQRGLAGVWSNTDLPAFDRWLVEYANALILRFDGYAKADSIGEGLRASLRNELASRVEHWKARGRPVLRQREAEHGVPDSKDAKSLKPSATVIRARKQMVERYRKEHGLTWESFAQGLAMSESNIRGVISGDRSRFGPDALNRLLGALKVTVEDWNSPQIKGK